MKKTLKFILLYMCFCIISLIPSKVVKAETRDNIANNSIRLLAYDYPYDIKQEWIEFKFVPQGNGTAKLKCYSNGKFINPNEIKTSLALYHKTNFKRTNTSGYEEVKQFNRATSMVIIAQYLETLTFTYDVDTIQVLPQAYYENEGLTAAKIDGYIYSTLTEPDFNNDLRFSARRELYRFRIRKDGLYAEYVPQIIIPNGEYIIETAENANKVVEAQGHTIRTGEYKSLNNQKLKLEYDDLRKAYKIKVSGGVFSWSVGNGADVINYPDNNNNDQFWYLEDAGNGKYRLINASDIYKILNLDADNTNISVSRRNNNSLKQQFNIVKIQDKLSITDGSWKIVSKINSSKVLNLDIGGIDRNNVTIWDDANVSQQKWRFKYDSSKDAYAIINSYSDNGLMWNVSNISTNVLALGQGYTNSQLWVLEDVGSGYYIFKNYHNQNMVLDLYNSDTRNASNIQVHQRHNGDNQKFKLVR